MEFAKYFKTFDLFVKIIILFIQFKPFSLKPKANHQIPTAANKTIISFGVKIKLSPTNSWGLVGRWTQK